MAQLLVRNLDDDVKRRLKRRAAAHGRSMEEEARIILREALRRTHESPEEGLGTRIAKRFRNVGFKEGEIQELRGHPIKPATFDE